MPDGFFTASQMISEKPVTSIPQCGICKLHKKCSTPKMPVSGQGRKGILLLGDYPSEADDEHGKHWAGESGALLRSALSNARVNITKDCWSTYALICKPTKTDPDKKLLRYCLPNLINTINELQPTVIITLGNTAIKSLMTHFWRKEKVPNVTAWAGTQIPSQKLNAWIFPVNSPRDVERIKKKQPIAEKFFYHRIKKACKETERPWDVVPDWTNDVDVELSSKKAARIIRQMIAKGGKSAFDYESNMLKPEFNNRKIICCSICWRGKKTIAYPWHGDAITATREYLQSSMPKIASNLKFEHRWSYSEFGIDVNEWWWDTMQGAHVIDNRKGITSVKFQAFVLLGAESYDEHISPFLKSKESKETNRALSEIDFSDLLLYCGLDSLLEYKVAEKQTKLIGYE